MGEISSLEVPRDVENKINYQIIGYTNKSKAVKAIKEVLNISSKEAKEITKSLPYKLFTKPILLRPITKEEIGKLEEAGLKIETTSLEVSKKVATTSLEVPKELKKRVKIYSNKPSIFIKSYDKNKAIYCLKALKYLSNMSLVDIDRNINTLPFNLEEYNYDYTTAITLLKNAGFEIVYSYNTIKYQTLKPYYDKLLKEQNKILNKTEKINNNKDIIDLQNEFIQIS